MGQGHCLIVPLCGGEDPDGKQHKISSSQPMSQKKQCHPYRKNNKDEGRLQVMYSLLTRHISLQPI